MGLKEKVYDLMKDPKGITVDVIAKELEIPENAVNSYIWRLNKEGKITDDNIIDKIYLDKNKTKGKKYYRYRVLEKPKDKKNSKNLKVNNDLIDKLVLLMIKAEINSEKYEINISESEIEHSIRRLSKGGLIG